MNRTIVVGDVHGCIEELESLLRACQFSPGDQLVFVGDLVAKGPDSQAVVQLARETSAWSVLGNHDRYVLKVVRDEPSKHPYSPKHVEVAKSLKPEDIQWLTQLPLTLQLPEYEALVVHGGFLPNAPWHQQEERVLLHLRSITEAGEAAFRADEGQPWASFWRGPEHVVFGHDAKRGLQQYALATGLDTGCVYGGALTALVFPQRELVSVKAFKAWAPKGGD